MTAISTLGEFGLIHHLTDTLRPQNASTLVGVGDDCAVLTYPERRVLVTSDMLMEGIHFDLVYTPLKHLGYKAAQVNFSDVYAMNGRPQQLVVSLALGRRFSVENVEEIYEGLRLACERHDVDLVGGDTCASLTGMALSLTCIGEAAPQDIVLRSGAQENDLICVSGNLGAAYMGLRLLEREKKVFETRPAKNAEAAQPDFAGKEYLLERFLKPEARRDIVERLAQAGLHPTSMIDVSDGLSSELLHLCRMSHCGCRLYEERIPIDYQTAATAEEFNMNLTTCALNGGEDYELLFTLPLSDYERALALEDVSIIGSITREALDPQLITRDGQEIRLRAQGFEAFEPDEDAEA